jgi:hypothetical protein
MVFSLNVPVRAKFFLSVAGYTKVLAQERPEKVTAVLSQTWDEVTGLNWPHPVF